jgi:hypothetical protein
MRNTLAVIRNPISNPNMIIILDAGSVISSIDIKKIIKVIGKLNPQQTTQKLAPALRFHTIVSPGCKSS